MESTTIKRLLLVRDNRGEAVVQLKKSLREVLARIFHS
jgi:hypothetical protein